MLKPSVVSRELDLKARIFRLQVALKAIYREGTRECVDVSMHYMKLRCVLLWWVRWREWRAWRWGFGLFGPYK